MYRIWPHSIDAWAAIDILQPKSIKGVFKHAFALSRANKNLVHERMHIRDISLWLRHIRCESVNIKGTLEPGVLCARVESAHKLMNFNEFVVN